MAFAISRVLHGRLLALAAANPDHEVCGLLFGSQGQIEAIEPCANVAPNLSDSFEIDPGALIRAHKAQRVGGPHILGCYHSHPNGLTTLSHRDREAYQEGQLWLILAGRSISAWAPARVPLTVIAKNGSFAWQ